MGQRLPSPGTGDRQAGQEVTGLTSVDNNEYNLGTTDDVCGNCGCEHYVALDGTVMHCINTDSTAEEVWARACITTDHPEMGVGDSCECSGSGFIEIEETCTSPN
jgi:hypothetical protein